MTSIRLRPLIQHLRRFFQGAVPLIFMILVTTNASDPWPVYGETPAAASAPPRQVWNKLDNGLQFGSLPLPSVLSESEQRAIIITSWNIGWAHDGPQESGLALLSAELLSRAFSSEAASTEVRSGYLRTWWIEKVAPKDVLKHLEMISKRLMEPLKDEALLAEVKLMLLGQQQKIVSKSVQTLSHRIQDRITPLRSGPWGQLQVEKIDLAQINKFIQSKFTAANVHIAIVGPHDPAPTLVFANRTLALATQGVIQQPPVVRAPVFGEIGIKRDTTGLPGAIIRSWRIPKPGSFDSLSLGIFIPRLIQILGKETVHWNPSVDPDLLTIRLPIEPTDAEAKIGILTARARLDAAIAFGLNANMTAADLTLARKSMGATLGISRVHDEESMINPQGAAEALMRRKLHDVDEQKQRNKFGRNPASQMSNLQMKYISQSLSVTGIVVPIKR